jgi:hypothetical protein
MEVTMDELTEVVEDTEKRAGHVLGWDGYVLAVDE